MGEEGHMRAQREEGEEPRLRDTDNWENVNPVMQSILLFSNELDCFKYWDELGIQGL